MVAIVTNCEFKVFRIQVSWTKEYEKLIKANKTPYVWIWENKWANFTVLFVSMSIFYIEKWLYILKDHFSFISKQYNMKVSRCTLSIGVYELKWYRIMILAWIHQKCGIEKWNIDLGIKLILLIFEAPDLC